jgi:hypothetical protein
MRTLCSWCSAVIREDDGTGGKDSHGICEKCADEIEAEAGAFNASKPKREEKKEPE